MLTRTHVYALSLITLLLILLLSFALSTLGFIIPRGHRTHSPPAGTSVAGGVRDLETFPRDLRSANWLLGQNIPRSHKILVASIRLEVVRVFKDQLDLANVRANVRHVVPVSNTSYK